MLRFLKVTLANFKNGKLFFVLVTSNFQELFVNKFNSKSQGGLKKKNLLLKGFIVKKTERGSSA